MLVDLIHFSEEALFISNPKSIEHLPSVVDLFGKFIEFKGVHHTKLGLSSLHSLFMHIGLGVPLAANLGRLAQKRPLLADLGRLSWECPPGG